MNIFKKFKYYYSILKKDIYWDLRIYDINELSNIEKGKNILSYLELKHNDKYWYADPMLIEKDNHTYVFFEQYDIKKRKGMIGYSEIINNRLTEPKVIIESTFHMSFPMIFHYNGDYYMIPETKEIGKLLLYKATVFPDEWEICTTILGNTNGTDTILINDEEKDYLLVSEDNNNDSCTMDNVLYQFDLNLMKIVDNGVIVGHGNIGIRNAGPIFYKNGKYVRPGQNCDGNIYGKGILFWDIKFSNGCYYETKSNISISPENLFGKDSEYSGTHTFCVGKKFIAVDCKKDIVNSNFTVVKLMFDFILKRIKRKMI